MDKTKEKYRKKLERAYELEGLLLLAMSKDEMPEGLESLIEKKIEQLMKAELEEEADGLSPAQETPRGEAPAEDGSLGGDAFYALEDDDDEVAVPSAEKTAEKGVINSGNGQPVFSLNDRFLFIRELFDGDAATFSEAISRVSSFRGFDDAEAYLEGELGLSPEESEEAGRFMEAIERYFAAKK